MGINDPCDSFHRMILSLECIGYLGFEYYLYLSMWIYLYLKVRICCPCASISDGSCTHGKIYLVANASLWSRGLTAQPPLGRVPHAPSTLEHLQHILRRNTHRSLPPCWVRPISPRKTGDGLEVRMMTKLSDANPLRVHEEIQYPIFAWRNSFDCVDLRASFCACVGRSFIHIS